MCLAPWPWQAAGEGFAPSLVPCATGLLGGLRACRSPSRALPGARRGEAARQRGVTPQPAPRGGAARSAGKMGSVRPGRTAVQPYREMSTVKVRAGKADWPASRRAE